MSKTQRKKGNKKEKAKERKEKSAPKIKSAMG